MLGTAPRRVAQSRGPSTTVRRPYAKPRPRGMLSLILRVPVLLYRIGLAGRLGPRLLLLTTVGRRTRRRRTVGLSYAIADGTVYVISGFGQTDWLRNLARTPEVEVRIGARSWPGLARRVRDSEEADHARGLFRQQGANQGPPRALRGLLRLMGLDYEAELEALNRPELDLPVVAIQRAKPI